MNIKSSLSILLLGILFISCTKNRSNNSEDILSEYKVSLEDSLEMDLNQVEVIKLLPLETNSQNLMGDNLRIRFNDSLIVIMDESIKDAIHIFSNAGKYINSVAYKIDDPNGILSLSDFLINEKGKIQVLSTMGGTASIYEYTLDNVKSKLLDIEYVGTSFTRLPGNKLLISGGHNLPFVKNRIVQYNDNGTPDTAFLFNDYTNKMYPVTERNFFWNNQDLYYIESFSNKIYKLANNAIASEIEIDMGRYGIPTRFWELDIMQGFEMINTQGFTNLSSIFKSNDFFFIGLLHQHNSIPINFINIYNYKQNKLYNLNYKKDYGDIFSKPVKAGAKNELTFLVYYSQLTDFNKKIPFSDKINQLKAEEYDYPILMTVKFNL